MTNKFIAVANKQEADRAAKYLESLGYVLIYDIGAEYYNSGIHCLSTHGNGCYYSDKHADAHRDIFKEEQLFVPADFEEPTQEPKEEYALSGVWQYYSPDDNEWITGSNQNRDTRQLIESQGVKTRDLYIKA